MAVVEGESFVFHRGKLEYSETDLDATFQAIEIELARELDEARAEIARLGQQVSDETAGAEALNAQVQASAAAAEAAGKRAEELQTELGAASLRLEEFDHITAENARLSQGLAEKEVALNDGRARIEFLESALAAAEAKAGDKRAEQLEDELRTERRRLQAKIDLGTAENARLAQDAAERDAALGDARARMKFLETALSAAESDCAKLAAEAGGAREKQDAETGRLEAMSSRAAAAEKQLVETRQQLLARIVENDALRRRLAHAEDAADTKNRQIDEALRQQRCEIEELERSHATLIEATKTLLETFKERDRARINAEERIKFLSERNAQLEARANPVKRSDEIDRTDTPRCAVADSDEKRRKDWAQLAQQLTDFVERKRRFSEELQMRSMTLLADIASF